MPYFPLLSSHLPLPLLLLFLVQLSDEEKTLTENVLKRGAVKTQVLSVCVFYCLPVPASRHSAFEAEYSWESVERFILERVVVD